MAIVQPDSDQPWTIEQACGYWGVSSKQTYYNWKKKNFENFPKEFKLGGGVRLWKSEVMAFTKEGAKPKIDPGCISENPITPIESMPPITPESSVQPEISPATSMPFPEEEAVPLVKAPSVRGGPVPPVTEFAIAAVRNLLIGNAGGGCPVCMDDVVAALHVPQAEASSVGYAERVLEQITSASFFESGILLGLLVFPKRPNVSPLASQIKQAKLLGRDVSTLEGYEAELVKIVRLYEVFKHFPGERWQWVPQMIGRNAGVPRLTRVSGI
jgi:predicted DNA-binding transcriptional regulator AlpA